MDTTSRSPNPRRFRKVNNRCTVLEAAAIFAVSLLAASPAAQAQKRLPNAPSLGLLASLDQASGSSAPASSTQAPPTSPQQTPSSSSSQTPETSAIRGTTAAAAFGPRLTVEQAERIAIQNNPDISVARLLALAQGQITRETRSAFLPTATADLTAVGAHYDSRLSGDGTLNSPRIMDKAAGGLTISQLITDFGHTQNLLRSSKSYAQAEIQSSRATQLDIRLAVDQAFYQALTTQAVYEVAQQTVAERQATDQQVGALEKTKVKSLLDLSFADVQLSQANLLLLDAKNNEQVAMAQLNNVLGSDQDQQYTLVDDTGGNPPPAPENPDALVQTAFQQRPDLAALNDRYMAARQYATAERDQWYPTISALAAGGDAPVRDDIFQTPWYLGAGANVNIPVFNGFLYNAQTKEARYRASAAHEQMRNLRDMIARDVRTAVLNAQTAYQRISVTQSMLNQANLALDLAQARYKIGLSSIVELTQAQLSQTQAQIAYTTARYTYQTALSEVNYEIGQ